MTKIRPCRASSFAQISSRVIAASLCLSASGVAYAQTESDPQQVEATPPNAVESNSGLADIVVTAQRRSERLQDVPVAITAFGGETLAKQGAIDTRDLVRLSPGVSFFQASSVNSGSFIIRGFASIGIVGYIQQSTALVLDGVPLVRAGEAVSDLGDVERVEILKGPQGTLFGKNATAGVVSIITKRPTDKFEAQAEASYTTDDEFAVRTMLNLPVSERARFRLNGFFDNLEPLIKNRDPRGSDGAGKRNYGVRGKFDLDLSDDIELRFTADYAKLSGSFTTYFPSAANTDRPATAVDERAQNIAALGYVPGRYPILNSDNDFKETAKIYSATAELAWRATDSLQFTWISSFRHFGLANGPLDIDASPYGLKAGVGFFLPDPTYPFPLGILRGGSRIETNYVTEELRANYHSDAVDVVAGVFYQGVRDRSRADRGGLLFPVGVPNTFALIAADVGGVRVRNNSLAGFADATWRFTDTLSVFGGLRYTHETLSAERSFQSYAPAGGIAIAVIGVNLDPVTGIYSGPFQRTIGGEEKRKNDNVSGRIGIQWQPASNLNYYFSYNTAYKGSAVNYSATAPQLIIGPEKANSFELGGKMMLLDQHLQLNVNLFRHIVKGLQQTILPPGQTTPQLGNFGELKSKGVEVDVQARVTDGLTLTGSAVYNDAVYGGKETILVPCYSRQTAAQGCTGGSQILNGTVGRNAYKWRFSAGATYTQELPDLPFNLELSTNYSWFDKAQLDGARDPLTVEPSHGLLDAALTLRDRNDRWSVQLFGHNLTNDFYWPANGAADGIISRTVASLARDYKRYGGVKVTFNF